MNYIKRVDENVFSAERGYIDVVNMIHTMIKLIDSFTEENNCKVHYHNHTYTRAHAKLQLYIQNTQ